MKVLPRPSLLASSVEILDHHAADFEAGREDLGQGLDVLDRLDRGNVPVIALRRSRHLVDRRLGTHFTEDLMDRVVAEHLGVADVPMLVVYGLRDGPKPFFERFCR